MTPKAKKLLDILKGPTSATPERKTGGTDPMEPWSAQNRISESPSLNQYLLSRGFDPKHTPKDIKVAHSKSNQFKLWQQHHVREDLTTGPTGAGVDHKTDLSVSPTKKRLDVLKKAKAHYNIPTPPGTLRREDVEQIDELKKSTLSSYIDKSQADKKARSVGADSLTNPMYPKNKENSEKAKELRQKAGKRGLGIAQAYRKIRNEPSVDHSKGKNTSNVNVSYKNSRTTKEEVEDVAEAGNGRPGTTPGFQDTLAADEKRREQRRQERKAQDKSTMQGINKNRAKADAYRKSGVAEEVELNEHDYFGKEAYAMIKQSQKHHADAQAAKAKGDHAEHERLRKLSSDTHKAAMEKAKEYRADPKNKDAVERSASRHMSGAAKDYGTGRYMGDSVELDGDQLDEISLGDYKQKAQAQTKELKKHTKGEYGGIAQRMLDRRKKGLAMANKREHKIETSSDVTEEKKDSRSASEKMSDYATKRHKVYQGIADKQKELMKKWNDDHKDEPHLQVPIPEDVGSPMAAIKGVPVPESRAQKIKAMYKKKVAEDTYDSEKDDKYGQNPTFGKKPVMKAIDNKSDRNVDGVKTKAAAVLTGGTTLTGQKRDTVQIDPQLNNPRPGQTDPNGDRSNK